MGRPRMPVGTYSTTITAVPQVKDDQGRYSVAPAGTPRKRIARWRAQGSVRDYTGKTVRVQKFAATKSEAERRLREAMEERLTGSEGEGLTPTSTVAEAAEAWYADAQARGTLSAGSLALYRVAVRKHICGTSEEPGRIALLQLREVTAPRVERALQHVADTSGNGIAKTVRTVYRNTFAYAVYQSAMPTNPVRDVRPVKAGGTKGRAGAERDTRRAFTLPELRSVLWLADHDEQARARDLGDLVHFLAATGVRLGEALALRWSDVRLDDGEGESLVSVGAVTVQRVRGQGLQIAEHGTTKRGERVLPLPEPVAERLRARRERVAMPNKHGVVFPAVLSGGLRDPSNTAGHLRALLDDAGLPWATSHTFRRTVATMLDAGGLAEREVSNFLGHAKVSMTQDVYLDRRQRLGRDAARLLDHGDHSES